ncbi:MAG TPA: hypothetical protein VI455_08790 [Terriglobia bacterium]
MTKRHDMQNARVGASAGQPTQRTALDPVRECFAAEEAESAPKRANPLNIISFYRQYARRCEAAARNAPNEQIRAEHSKMVHVWREFAAEHERMVHEGSDFARLLNQSLKDWFLDHRIREAMAPLSTIVMGGDHAMMP